MIVLSAPLFLPIVSQFEHYWTSLKQLFCYGKCQLTQIQ
ncbi:hypothetical protein J535_3379 [Acinetobacter baumannii 1429530]|nr:hypothetical protein J535_3379 [Acinetobacter baumannii 1429530]